MTIFFVPSRDSQTASNHAVALHMVAQGDVPIFADHATRARLHSELQANPSDKHIFAMSHGSPTAVEDTNEEEALTTADAVLLQGYRVFSWACLTANELGKVFAANNSVWWGYDCSITAPDERDPYLIVFRDALLSLKNFFATGVDPASASAVLERARAEALRAEQRLHALGASDDVEAMALFSCCNQMWQHLRVWLPGHAQMIAHPEAPSSSIFG